MNSEGLRARIERETGVEIVGATDQYKLAGLFNRYRPNGDGLERLLSAEGQEGKIRDRVEQVINLTASSWRPGDIYFVLRQFEPIDEATTVRLVSEHLNGMALLADFMGDTESRALIGSLTIAKDFTADFTPDNDLPVLIYECLTDFLAKFQPSTNELFLLKEALYSMANDYFLTAYMLWPAITESTLLPEVFDPYFQLWSHGLKLDYSADARVFVAKLTAS